MKTYPRLYSRDNHGRIRVWFMEQEGNQYRTISGLSDGKLNLTKFTVAKVKNVGRSNETSGEEQAQKEIEAKYEKQIKEGYFERIEDIDNARPNEVMLAESYIKNIHRIDFKSGVVVQCKFNGMRCCIEHNVPLTRKFETYMTIPHILKSLETFFERFPNAVLDGELYNYDLRQRLNDLNSLIRLTKHITPEDLVKSEQMVRFYVYDGYGFGASEDDDYFKRKAAIDEILPQFSQYFRHVDDFLVHSSEEVDELYNRFLDDGQEGAIIRIPSVGYQHKRTRFLLKLKPEDDAEFIIVNIIEGDGDWSGTGKKIVFRDKEGKTFGGSFKGKKEECAQFWKERDKWIGREVSVLYNGLTGLGTPNYARMDWRNCIKS